MNVLIIFMLIGIVIEIKAFRKELMESLGYMSYTNDLILMELKQT